MSKVQVIGTASPRTGRRAATNGSPQLPSDGSTNPDTVGATLTLVPASERTLSVDILPADETPEMLNETVRRWREGQDG